MIKKTFDKVISLEKNNPLTDEIINSLILSSEQEVVPDLMDPKDREEAEKTINVLILCLLSIKEGEKHFASLLKKTMYEIRGVAGTSRLAIQFFLNNSESLFIPDNDVQKEMLSKFLESLKMSINL